jgi:hypothetical protein
MFLRIDCIVCDLALISSLTWVYPGLRDRNVMLRDRYVALTIADGCSYRELSTVMDELR